MKKLTAVLLVLCMLLPLAANAEVWATLFQPIATRTGPGTKYTEPGGFLSRGDQVLVRTKVWDAVNEIWWVQVEFTPPRGNTFFGRDKIRVYTGAWRMDVDLSRVPEEYPLQNCTVICDADAFTGLYYNGFEYWPDTIYAGTYATLYEVEDGFAHIECWNDFRGSMWRGWVRLETLSCASSYSYHGYYGAADDTPYYSGGYRPAQTNPPSTYYGDTQGFPVGRICTIIASSAHARSGPGTQYDTAAYVYDGERYEILECKEGNTGKDWYKIYVGKEYRIYAWISSGLCSVE